MRARFSGFMIALVLLGASAEADDAILVLDASGSMWGQIDGKSKAEIARAVIGELLDELPSDRRLGLVAYGHRREADCADIEQVVPVGTDRAAIRNAVGKLNFKGRTPLSAAVQFAAKQLRNEQQPATVILVSDGMETCNLDPCAIGRELEAAGIDFTAHVIGFGLASETESAGLRCIAEATGGQYIAANDSAGLAAALTKTVSAKEPTHAPQVATVVLRATELDGGLEIAAGLEWTIRAANGTAMLERSNAGVVETELPPGSYEVVVVRTSDRVRATASLVAHAGVERTLTIPLAIDLSATLKVTPAATAPAGSSVAVEWSGPNRDGDYVTVVHSGATASDYANYAYTARGNPVTIELPGEPGAYEIRYVLGRPQRVLATVAYQATDVSATLAVPASGIAGSNVKIEWTGPNYSGDWITVVKPEAADTAYEDYFNASNGDGLLVLPLVPGPYEVRYVQGGKKILARAPIDVRDAVAKVAGPPSGVAGADVKISWTGPNNAADWITIVKPDAGNTAYADYFNANNGDGMLELSVEPGPYEIRYVQSGTKILARAPIDVTAARAELSGPASVTVGSSFQISWSGPDYGGDWITIVAPDAAPSAYGSYVDAARGSPATLTAPTQPGPYQLRYVLKGKSVIARRAIDVTPAP
ncbi:MAG: VWA domain-containing protein [Gammaproteobacteria bacterium]|nr:VWA domain-containing protein [Gammaproteobacteria bacterium]